MSNIPIFWGVRRKARKKFSLLGFLKILLYYYEILKKKIKLEISGDIVKVNHTFMKHYA